MQAKLQPPTPNPQPLTPTPNPQPLTPAIWRRLPLERAPAEAQVAWAVAMADGQIAPPVLCWYFSDRPTLIRGVFQAEAEINTAACAARGIAVVRRRSGGTGVLAGPNLLSLDIALPPGHRLAPPDVTEAYRWLGLAWLMTLA